MAHDVLRRAGEIEGNLGGVVFAALRAVSTSFDMPWESLMHQGRRDPSPRFLATHVRSPGFRVLVPSGAVAQLADSPMNEKVAHGVLLASPASDPFAYDGAHAEAMERLVLPLLGGADPEP